MALAMGVVAQVDGAATCTNSTNSTNGVCEAGHDTKGGALTESDVFKTIFGANDVLRALGKGNVCTQYLATVIDAALVEDDPTAAFVSSVLKKVPPTECINLWVDVKKGARKLADGLHGIKVRGKKARGANPEDTYQLGDVMRGALVDVKEGVSKLADGIHGIKVSGKKARGANAEDGYQVGDFTRGLIAGARAYLKGDKETSE
jgi:hypothetical protein